MTLCRCPFLQNVKISNNHFEKTQALKMSIQTLQVPATFFLMTLAHCRFPFLQKLQLFNNHFMKTPALKITILELQVPATFFLTTSALKINILELQVLATTILRMCSHCGMSFLQNNQLFNNHPTPDHLICQERDAGNHCQKTPSLPRKKPRRNPTLSPTSRWKARKSTSRTSERGLTRC